MPPVVRPLAAVLPLAGCMSLALPAAPHTEVFTCAGAERITVTFTPERARLVEPDGRVIELEQRRAGSGFRYEGPAGTLLGEDREIRWTPLAGPPRVCVAAPARVTPVTPVPTGAR